MEEESRMKDYRCGVCNLPWTQCGMFYEAGPPCCESCDHSLVLTCGVCDKKYRSNEGRGVFVCLPCIGSELSSEVLGDKRADDLSEDIPPAPQPEYDGSLGFGYAFGFQFGTPPTTEPDEPPEGDGTKDDDLT